MKVTKYTIVARSCFVTMAVLRCSKSCRVQFRGGKLWRAIPNRYVRNTTGEPMTYRNLSLFLGLALLAGCGGRGSLTPNAVPRSLTKVAVTIHWPAVTRKA